MPESKHPDDAADQIDMSNPGANEAKKRAKAERIAHENAAKMEKLRKRS